MQQGDRHGTEKDNRPLAFIAWSTAIQSALSCGGDLNSIAESASNIGLGMCLSANALDADRNLFDWDAISARLAAQNNQPQS